jgi:uncharacterized protein
VIVVADTSGIVAAYDGNSPDADKCADALSRAALLVLSPLVLAELDHVATREFGRPAALSIIDEIRRWAAVGRLVVADLPAGALDIAQGLRSRYADLDLDLADAVNVVLAEQYRTDAVLTLDRRDFRALRPLSGYLVFRLLPDDA